MKMHNDDQRCTKHFNLSLVFGNSGCERANRGSNEIVVAVFVVV